MIGTHSPRLLVTAVCVAVLSGCVSMAPTYERPDAPVPAQFRDAAAQAGNAGPVAALQWQQVFLDQRLQQVIAQALDNNRDLRVALLNIEKARAQYRIQRAELMPGVDGGASQTSQRGSGGNPQVTRSADLDVGLSSWELDLFGRIRSLKDEALENWLATSETQRSTRLSLIAEVVNDWLTVSAYQQQLLLAEQTLESQRQTLLLTERRHASGTVSGVDLASVQATVEQARADVARFRSTLAQARNALELVVGAPVADALLPGAGPQTAAVLLAPLPAGLDSQVLLERPDVLAAEHSLMAANANIGAARAAFFPSITLTGSVGRASDSLDNLFSGGTRSWSFIPSITVPIFQGGALKASLDVSKISAHVAVAEYEKAIQTAFAEVADALAVRTHVDERLDAQQAYVTATGRSHALAEARYRSGVASYLEALEAQRALYAARQDLITLQLEEAGNRVTLYRVLGGGEG